MKEPTAFPDKLGVGGSLSLAELRSMAGRQQDQIERQAQILLAREQRLKFLRNQEARGNQLTSSKERLTALHQRVDQQEAKLRRLRALRGQVENTQGNNNKLSSDLECVKSLFNEKEKELSLAVARVEELTRQLEELRRGRLRPSAHNTTSKEIQRLRQELLYRSQLSSQQSSQLTDQRGSISNKRDELTRMDRRIAELQQRLSRKRQLNQQLTQQLTARQAQPATRRPNVAAVEPYQREDLHSKLNDELGEFGPSKHDPKYQTLPYNTKFHAPAGSTQGNLNDLEKPVVSSPAPLNASTVTTRGYSSVYSISSAPPSITVRSQPVGGSGAPATTQENGNVPNAQIMVTSLKGDVLPPTPLTAPAENGGDIEKPALPPKPPLPKPLVPPRQSFAEKVDTSPESVDSALCVLRGVANSKHPPVHRFANRHLLQSAHGFGSSENTAEDQDNLVPNVHISINRRIEMPPAFLFPEPISPDQNDRLNSQEKDDVRLQPTEGIESESDLTRRLITDGEGNTVDDRQPDGSSLDGHTTEHIDDENGNNADLKTPSTAIPNLVARVKKGNLKSSAGSTGHAKITRRVSFDPLALMLDASLEGELELVKKCASEVVNPSAANDEGITALHNAVCAGHFHIVKFLVEYGCDVNAQDSDGWTPLHCAASCNNLEMLEYLVERGACIFATTLSDHDTAADKCEEDEIGFQGCSQYLYNIQEKLGIMKNGVVYALYAYDAQNADELSFQPGDPLTILRKGDEAEKEWWWAKRDDREGYVPRNLLGLYPRYKPPEESTG